MKDELKQFNREKIEFISDDIQQLLKYHSITGLYYGHPNYAEHCQSEILHKLLDHAKGTKTHKELINLINTFIISMNPL